MLRGTKVGGRVNRAGRSVSDCLRALELAHKPDASSKEPQRCNGSFVEKLRVAESEPTQPHICSKSPSRNLTFTQNQIFLKSHSHNLTLTKHGTHSTWDLISLTHILSLLLAYSTNIFSTPHPGDPTFTEPHIPSAHVASRVALCACALVFCNAVRLCAAEPLHQDEIWEVEFMRNTLLLRVYVCRSGWKVSWVACDCGHQLGMEECWKWGIQVIAVSLH